MKYNTNDKIKKVVKRKCRKRCKSRRNVARSKDNEEFRNDPGKKVRELMKAGRTRNRISKTKNKRHHFKSQVTSTVSGGVSRTRIVSYSVPSDADDEESENSNLVDTPSSGFVYDENNWFNHVESSEIDEYSENQPACSVVNSAIVINTGHSVSVYNEKELADEFESMEIDGSPNNQQRTLKPVVSINIVPTGNSKQVDGGYFGSLESQPANFDDDSSDLVHDDSFDDGFSDDDFNIEDVGTESWIDVLRRTAEPTLDHLE